MVDHEQHGEGYSTDEDDRADIHAEQQESDGGHAEEPGGTVIVLVGVKASFESFLRFEGADAYQAIK